MERLPLRHDVHEQSDVFAAGPRGLLRGEPAGCSARRTPSPLSSGFLDNHFYSLINNAGMILVILPLLILYLFMQRYFVESIERTGIVG